MNGKSPNLSHIRTFGCKCFVHNNDKTNLGKFDARSDEGVFIGYSDHSKAYKVYNKRTRTVEESVHVLFDETTHGKEHDDLNLQTNYDFDDDFELGMIRH